MHLGIAEQQLNLVDLSQVIYDIPIREHQRVGHSHDALFAEGCLDFLIHP